MGFKESYMKKISFIEIDGTEVCLKRKGKNFSVIKPIFDKDGNFNLFNFLTGGSWTNIIVIALVVFIILGLLREYSHNMQVLMGCVRNPYVSEFCTKLAFGG